MTARRKAEVDPAKNRMKVRAWRAKMRAKGLRPIQIWVHDTRAPGFIEEARRQARAAAASEHERNEQAFIDAISVDLWKE